MDGKNQSTNMACALVALSIFEYYSISIFNLVHRIAFYTKIPFSGSFMGQLFEVEIPQRIQQALRNMLNTLYATTQYILLVTTNMCFGLVIIFLIVKHLLQNINIYEPKYYTLTIF